MRGCLASIGKALQQVGSSELIVVDNGDRATDAIRQIVQDFGATYVWEGVRGLSTARNRGILEVAGSIVAFVDDDVTVSEDWAKLLVNNFSDPQVTVVTGAVLAGDTGTDVGAIWYRLYQPFLKARTILDVSSKLPFFPITAGLCGIAANMAFRKPFFYRHGFFDPSLGAGRLTPGGEEIDRFYAALTAGGKILFDPKMSVQHTFLGSHFRLLRKVFCYAAGQSACLTKWFVRDRDSRATILAFVRDRLLAFCGGRHLPAKKLGAVRAPRFPLLLGSLWGPLGYFFSCVREGIWPHRSVLVPGQVALAVSSEGQDKPRVLMSLYNAGLTGPEKLSVLLARRLPLTTSLKVLLPSPGPATAQIHNLGVPVGIIPRWRLRATLNLLYQVGYLMALPGTIKAFVKIIRAASPDVVHVHSILNLPAMLAAKLAKKPLLSHVHEIYGGLAGKLLRFLAFLLSDRILAVSEAVAQTFPQPSQGQLQRVFVVHNGVEVASYAHNATDPASEHAQGPQWITFIGRLSDDKGPHLFVRAAEQVYRQHPSSYFRICGLSVPNRTGYERMLADMIHGSIIPSSQFVLEKDREDIEQILRAASMVVSCSSAPDPFPMAILEAMALAKPVVVPPVGGLPEMVLHEKTGLLYPPGDVQELARAIIRVLRDPGLAREFGLAAQKRVEDEFGIDETAETILSHYEALRDRRA